MALTQQLTKGLPSWDKDSFIQNLPCPLRVEELGLCAGFLCACQMMVPEDSGMDPHPKRSKQSHSQQELGAVNLDSADADSEEGGAGGSVTATEGLCRLRTCLLQLPCGSARKECMFLESWVKGLLIPEDVGDGRLASDPVVGLLENGLLQLLPDLLQARCERVVVGAVEIVGALSLFSTDTNEEVATNGFLVARLIDMLECRSLSVLLAICHSLDDIMVTPLGCSCLVKAGALQALMRLLCWITDDIPCGADDDEVNELFGMVLDSVSHLSGLQLTATSSELVQLTLSKLQKLWRSVNGDVVSDGNELGMCLLPGVSCKRSILAGLIVRLSMETEFLGGYKHVIRFTGQGLLEANFFKDYWEFAPVLIKKGTADSLQFLFNSLKQRFCLGNSEDLLLGLLSGMTACPSVPADEVNVLNMFKDMEGRLGGPMLYGQDVRIVKSAHIECITSTSSERHYMTRDQDVHVTDCVKAFKSGYTVAVRGMEFRCPQVAAIADCLAMSIGQASVGANLYLTPSNAQGLAVHYDDHCVLVCQIHGHKHWSIYPPQHLLPHLYTTRCPVQTRMPPTTKVLVEQGDWCYIPRGFPHHAYSTEHCIGKAGDAGSKPRKEESFSLHLTFGMEVEPPFKWEGFMHIALHYFAQKRIDAHKFDGLGMGLWKERESLIIMLLHVAVREIGNKCTGFRKACTVAALASEARHSILGPGSEAVSGCSNCTLGNANLQVPEGCSFSPEDFFQSLLGVVAENASCETALKMASNAMSDKGEDCLSWISWLQQLPSSSKDMYSADGLEPARLFFRSAQSSGELLSSSLQAEFDVAKLDFVNNASFGEGCAGFQFLLQKYRDSRRKLINGLLALHAEFS